MKTYDYLVSYTFDKVGCLTWCHDTSLISRTKKIKTFEDIKEISKLLENNIDGAKNIGINNFILLGKNKH